MSTRKCHVAILVTIVSLDFTNQHNPYNSSNTTSNLLQWHLLVILTPAFLILIHLLRHRHANKQTNKPDNTHLDHCAAIASKINKSQDKEYGRHDQDVEGHKAEDEQGEAVAKS